jgi:hypothetical protein
MGRRSPIQIIVFDAFTEGEASENHALTILKAETPRDFTHVRSQETVGSIVYSGMFGFFQASFGERQASTRQHHSPSYLLFGVCYGHVLPPT